MSNLVFIEEWNNVVPFKINEFDLSKPTENFVLNATLSYLKMLNIDLSRMFDNCDGTEIHKKKIKLVGYINHLYKMTDNSHNFYYIDLLHPPPKKTVHMLKILLNYLKFVNMVKSEIIETSTIDINKFEQLSSKCKEFELKNLKKKELTKTIDHKLAKYENELPVLSEKHTKLEQKLFQLNDEYLDHETKLKHIEHNITNVNNQEEKLKHEMIHDSEINYLLNQCQAIQSELDEQGEMETIARERNMDIARAIPRIKNINEQLNKLTDILDKLLTKTNINDEMKSYASKEEVEKKLNEDYKVTLEKMEGVFRVQSKYFEQQKVQHVTDVNTMKTEIQTINKKLFKINENITEKNFKVDELHQQFEQLSTERQNTIDMANQVFEMLSSLTLK